MDATNIVSRPVVCGITTLDLDHTHVLGHTLEAIAYEKAGNCKPDVPVLTVAQALHVLQEQAQRHGTHLTLVPSGPPLANVYRTRGLRLAREALDPRDATGPDDPNGSYSIIWMGPIDRAVSSGFGIVRPVDRAA